MAMSLSISAAEGLSVLHLYNQEYCGHAFQSMRSHDDYAVGWTCDLPARDVGRNRNARRNKSEGVLS
ncbi:hypothetical protein BDW68DRAFT_161414 [Aspergillus falconensis]